jgi:hypothetical protein
MHVIKLDLNVFDDVSQIDLVLFQLIPRGFQYRSRNCRYFIHFSTDGRHGETFKPAIHFTFQAPARMLQFSYNLSFLHIYATLK